MIVQRTRGLLRLLAFVQAGLASAIFWLLFVALSFSVLPGTAAFAGQYGIYWVILLAGVGFEVFTRSPDKVTSPIYASSLVRQLPLAARQVGFPLGVLLLDLALTKDRTISRTFLAIYAAALYGMFLWSNAKLPRRLARVFFSDQRDLATLLVGPTDRVGRLDFWLKHKRQFGLRIVGVVTIETVPMAENCPVPLLGAIDQFDAICDRAGVVQVILLELCPAEQTRWLLGRCHERGMRLLIVNDLAEQIQHPISCVEDEGVSLIMLREEPLENPFNRMLKRMLDLTLSAFVVVFIMPWLIVLVWSLHRWQSPGPLWHRQARAGLQNRPFQILKFRTMHATPTDQAQQAQPRDARIFPAGRWLRHFSLDEIPQFWNVLKGEMSAVGPRPHLVEHNRRFAAEITSYHLRTLIKPGITGLAQVRGFRGEARTPEDITARLQSDLVYLEGWSLPLDLGIILRTIGQMIKPPPTAV